MLINRSTTLLLIIALILSTGCSRFYNEPYSTYYDDSDFDTPFFDPRYEELGYYGVWINTHEYGYVWRPDVSLGHRKMYDNAASDRVNDGYWHPFLYGEWIYTDYDWTWYSFDPFGWLTCHYGNWYWDSAYNWVWVPGEQWHPAPVAWYEFDDYIAWAPFPPDDVDRIGDPWSAIYAHLWVVIPYDDLPYYRVFQPADFFGPVVVGAPVVAVKEPPTRVKLPVKPIKVKIKELDKRRGQETGYKRIEPWKSSIKQRDLPRRVPPKRNPRAKDPHQPLVNQPPAAGGSGVTAPPPANQSPATPKVKEKEPPKEEPKKDPKKKPKKPAKEKKKGKKG